MGSWGERPLLSHHPAACPGPCLVRRKPTPRPGGAREARIRGDQEPPGRHLPDLLWSPVTSALLIPGAPAALRT